MNISKKTFADLVVYGKVFTAEGNHVAEAFAVKDGKYVYVGDRKKAGAFVKEGKTEVVDYTGKGLVMPGCGNGHAHYLSGYALQTVGAAIGMDDDVNICRIENNKKRLETMSDSKDVNSIVRERTYPVTKYFIF